VAVVTKPFLFEGGKRMRQAEKSLTELAACVDTLITIPNERLLAIVPRGTSFVRRSAWRTIFCARRCRGSATLF